MGTNECSQPASKSSWDSQDFGDVNMVLKMVHFHKPSRPQWVKSWTANRPKAKKARVLRDTSGLECQELVSDNMDQSHR